MQSEVEIDFPVFQIKHKIFQSIYANGGNLGAKQWPKGHYRKCSRDTGTLRQAYSC